MYDALLVQLHELRSVKLKLASRAFYRHYDAWRNGRDEESRVIRTGALQELEELLTIDGWITKLGGPACGGRCDPEEGACESSESELGTRCRLIRLVQQKLAAPRCETLAGHLRMFLAKLAADEAGRLDALLERRTAQTC